MKQYFGTGRRKSSVARVILKKGTGKVTVNNGKKKNVYFTDNVNILKEPLTVTGNEKKYDVIINVNGGGFTGQLEAARLGIARALLEISENNRQVLRAAGFLTRDSRMKERKKFGLKAARKAPQYSKR